MARRLKILFMTPNMEDSVCINCYTELEKAVAKTADCKWAGEGYPLHRSQERLDDTVQRVMPDVDWVLYYAFEVLLKKKNVRVPRRRNYKVAVYTGDIHRVVDQQVNYINGHGWDALLMLYTQLGAHVDLRARKVKTIDPEYYLKNVNAPIFHMAPCINSEVFHPRGEKRVVDVAFLAAIGKPWYPLRTVMWNLLPKISKQYHWKTVKRMSPPGRSMERKISKLQARHFVGERYAELLGKTKIFAFGTSVFKYPLLKFPESMACGAVAASDIPLTAEEYHLVPDWNFIAINKENWYAKINYYVKHNNEREEIAYNGYDTIMKYHTTDIRAAEVVRFLGEHR